MRDLLATLREMDEKATKGPWIRSAGNIHGVAFHTIGNDLMLGIVGKDKDVCANLRNALPALIAFVEAADGFADHAHNMLAQAERLHTYDAARARLLAAITGEKP